MRLTTSHHSAVVLRFRDKLRIEYDDAFRTAFIHISGAFEKLPTRAWNEIRRDSTRNDRPWGRLLRTVDEACVAGASEDALLELPALLTSYIYARRAQLRPTPAGGAVAIPQMRKVA
jgi:hypothetical protein